MRPLSRSLTGEEGPHYHYLLSPGCWSRTPQNPQLSFRTNTFPLSEPEVVAQVPHQEAYLIALDVIDPLDVSRETLFRRENSFETDHGVSSMT